MRYLLLLLFVSVASAEQFDATKATNGLLSQAQTAVGASTNTLFTGTSSAFRGVMFTARNTNGNATVELQVNCTGDSLDWATVADGKAIGALTAEFYIQYPMCEYRANVTACSNCNVSVFYHMQSWGSGNR